MSLTIFQDSILAIKPKVTIIIPTFNRPWQLKRAIQSVLSQSFVDFELLVLDDCSGDETRLVVSGFSDERIAYIRHPSNLGFSGNWTYGVKIAKGEFISILGDDDYYKPDFIMNRINIFNMHSGIAAVTGDFDCHDVDGINIRRSKFISSNEEFFSDENLIDLALGSFGEWFNGATLYNASIYKSLWDSSIFAGTAVDLAMHINISLMPNARIAYIPFSDMVLSVHENQISIKSGMLMAENIALISVKFWHLNVKKNSKIRSRFKMKLSKNLNHYGRVLWDQCLYQQSSGVFMSELSINPYNLKTWLRLIRVFITKK